MSLITIAYVLAMLAAVIWLGYKIRGYLRHQDRSETRWDQLMTEDELKAYAQQLRKEQGKTAKPDLAVSSSTGNGTGTPRKGIPPRS